MTADVHVSDLESVERAVVAAGFVTRGAFHVEDADRVPGVAPGTAATLVLVGGAGRDGFEGFRASAEFADGAADPLDRYSERVIGALSRRLGARALFPHQGPPWPPFQRWAARGQSVSPSPLGVLIHPTHGLWHAYRGALLFAIHLDGVSPQHPVAAPCETCDARPCLDACPVGAFSPDGFDGAACAAHLASPEQVCLERGCLARGACPVAPGARYGAVQMQFHMRAFARSQGVPTG